MKLPIEDFSEQTTKLLEGLDIGSTLHNTLDSAINSFWLSSKESEQLFRFHQTLNNDEIIKNLQDKKHAKLVEEINKSILVLIQESLKKQCALQDFFRPKTKKPKTSRLSKALLITVAILGTLFAAADGASIIQSLIGAFTALSHLSNFVLIPIQIGFAVLAVLTFYGLELNNVAKGMGVRLFDVNKTFKLYNEQSHLYKESFEYIQSALVQPNLNQKTFIELKKTNHHLKTMYGSLKNKVDQAREAQRRPSTTKTVIQKVILTIAALVCGTIGAIGAQACLPSILTLIIGASAATGPVGFGITLAVMGICFLAGALIYISIERKTTNKLIDTIWGTPAKKINQLIEKDSQIQRTKSDLAKHFEDKAEKYVLEEENRRLKATLAQQTGKTPAVEAISVPAFNSEERRITPPLQNNPSLMQFSSPVQQPQPTPTEWPSSKGLVVQG